jgi:hypothetical protein
MLHLVDNIRSYGPSWVYWCFVIERFCGSLFSDIKSYSNLYPSMTKRMIEGAQVSQIKCLYPDLKQVLGQSLKNLSLESENAEDQEMTARHEMMYLDCE